MLRKIVALFKRTPKTTYNPILGNGQRDKDAVTYGSDREEQVDYKAAKELAYNNGDIEALLMMQKKAYGERDYHSELYYLLKLFFHRDFDGKKKAGDLILNSKFDLCLFDYETDAMLKRCREWVREPHPPSFPGPYIDAGIRNYILINKPVCGEPKLAHDASRMLKAHAWLYKKVIGTTYTGLDEHDALQAITTAQGEEKIITDAPTPPAASMAAAATPATITRTLSSTVAAAKAIAASEEKDAKHFLLAASAREEEKAAALPPAKKVTLIKLTPPPAAIAVAATPAP